MFGPLKQGDQRSRKPRKSANVSTGKTWRMHSGTYRDDDPGWDIVCLFVERRRRRLFFARNVLRCGLRGRRSLADEELVGGHDAKELNATDTGKNSNELKDKTVEESGK